MSRSNGLARPARPVRPGVGRGASDAPPGARRAALPLAVLLAALSCGPPAPPKPNIVVIVIDTLRRDHLPFYGYERETAPFLSGLAAAGAVFERVHSTSSWTAPATASLFTSLYPVQHGVREGFHAAQARGGGGGRFRLDALPEEIETLGEAMKRAGYETFAITDNINISPLAGFHQGFDRFWYTNDAGSRRVNATLREQAERIGSASPYFLYLHYMDPHRPYQRVAPWYEAEPDSLADEIAAYDSEIRAVDAAIEEAFRLFGWERGTILVVTADHGEEFFEHGGWDHGRTLFSEVLDLPLLIYSGEGGAAPRRFAERVSILDILPTLRSAAGAPPVAGDRGIDLLSAVREGAPPPSDRVFLADLRRPPWFGGETLKARIGAGLKFVWTLPEEGSLFDLAADPGETSDIGAARRAEAAEARAAIRAAEEALAVHEPARAEVDLEREQVDKLRALGYIQ
ncbi:MAG: hypothetical protein EHM19_06340 [Candidatus Latescibacterota bacterium]|nr:MAG: hypothetical protein EHM19_06340 [Candidatus Latescibacterota bacterium]